MIAGAPGNLAKLDNWVGRTEDSRDQLVSWQARALAATLESPNPPTGDGDLLPPLWHWIYFKPEVVRSHLGEDGHPSKGGFLPPVPLPRRMWAGGRLHWNLDNPLRLGQTATRHSMVAAVTPKTGRSGSMVFVTVVHEIGNTQGYCVREEQDIVYRAPTPSGSAATSSADAPDSPAWLRHCQPDEAMLFRYSALTFNSHRIHYDQPYVTGVEGYPGLVVHGPLMATLLADLLRREQPELRLASFEFRGQAPAFCGQMLGIAGKPEVGRVDLWAQDSRGRELMRARAVLA